MGYSLCMHDGRFSKCSHFSLIWCFLERFFAQKNSKTFVEWILTCFLEFKFFSQSEDFAWAIAFSSMMADFQNALIPRIFSVFGTNFLHRKTLNDL